ncbi:MAG: MBL fold metallo-hydrolase [Candidatus Diapherotrites archaeon]|nr:MBL fold metallo-hydrolase [Candidatus Diapherotrites archaeon]
MELVLLGSEGAGHFPRPCCFCKDCEKARASGFERTGPALIETTQGLLFDTPEEIALQLNRERIKKVSAVFYTHWHPDHTQGMRIFEHLGHPDVSTGYVAGAKKPVVKVFIPEHAMPDFKKYLSHIFYYAERGWIEIIPAKNRQQIKFGNITVAPVNFKRPDRQRFGYVIQQGQKKVVYMPCSIFGSTLDPLFFDADLVFMETGWIGKTVETRASKPETSTVQDHISFEENLALANTLRAKKVVLTHIEATQHMTKEKLEKILARHNVKNIVPAEEGMKFNV